MWLVQHRVSLQDLPSFTDTNIRRLGLRHQQISEAFIVDLHIGDANLEVRDTSPLQLSEDLQGKGGADVAGNAAMCFGLMVRHTLSVARPG